MWLSRRNVSLQGSLGYVGRGGRLTGCGVGSGSASRSERPVRVRKTSSSVGRCTSMESRSIAGAVQVAQQARHGAAGAGHPAADVLAVDLDAVARRRPSAASFAAAAATCSASATSRSTRSPETCALRLSEVSAATIRPWSMIRIRSESASASSR